MTVDAPGAHPGPTGTRAPVPRGRESHPGREGRGRRWGVGRIAVVLVVVVLVAMWAYVVYLAVGPGRQPPIDRLSDPAFARAAEERCAAARDEVEALPVASEADSAVERSRVLRRANGIYTEMVDDLAGLAGLAPAGDERERTREWLADWRTHLGDRRAYASALQTDPEARLLVSEKQGEGRHITGWIDEFAKANRMPSCASPDDA